MINSAALLSVFHCLFFRPFLSLAVTMDFLCVCILYACPVDLSDLERLILLRSYSTQCHGETTCFYWSTKGPKFSTKFS
eukprot:SAG22_NODE_155_length_17123_cov_37.528489_27_plen_79_part_00